MLDAAKFHKMHRRTAAGARENFLHDGALHGVALLYNVQGEQFVAMLANPETPIEEAQRLFEQKGVLLVLGPWREHLPQLEAFAHMTGAVAGTLINEIWVATNENAAEVMTMGIAVSDHPLKDEAIAVISVFPQQDYSAVALDRIVRQRNGSGVKLERIHGELTGAELAGWLIDILPPH